jgi:hypothetical protein
MVSISSMSMLMLVLCRHSHGLVVIRGGLNTSMTVPDDADIIEVKSVLGSSSYTSLSMLVEVVY